jgi:hypothetical protein
MTILLWVRGSLNVAELPSRRSRFVHELRDDYRLGGVSFRLRHGASNCLSAYCYERDAELSEIV